MTAEVVVLNKSAIAVAADSAVTRGRNKVHVSANKIFQIHKTMPLGIVVYNFAEVFGLPWELIVKSFREEHSTVKFPSLSDCCDAFFKHLHSREFVTDEAKEQDLAMISISLFDELVRNCRHLTVRHFNNAFSENMDILLAEIEHRNDISPLSFSRRYGSFCKEVCNDPTLPKVSASNRTKFVGCVHKYIQSQHASDYYSGFAIFGFGHKELLPRLCQYQVDGAPLGELRVLASNSTSIERQPGKRAALLAFAQSDAASLFMEDISPATKDFFLESMRKGLRGFGAKIFKEVEGSIEPDAMTVTKAIINREISDFMKKYEVRLSDFIQANSVSPVVSSIDGLGKEDMAKLAESIVELTALKKRVSRDIETVGGPIDVAVISKGDGFVWIKRKHYFDYELNRSFYMNYFDRRYELNDGAHRNGKA